ncbi:hypothetical protein J2S58_003205 [Nakamurella flavida]|nr:hypothetical protein [Nakamurella flavida]
MFANAGSSVGSDGPGLTEKYYLPFLRLLRRLVTRRS